MNYRFGEYHEQQEKLINPESDKIGCSIEAVLPQCKQKLKYLEHVLKMIDNWEKRLFYLAVKIILDVRVCLSFIIGKMS